MNIALPELRDAAAKAFPADRISPDRDASWRLIVDLGWLLLELPEQTGGLELGPEAVATVHYEIAPALPRAPFLPGMLGLKGVAASRALPDREEWIERLTGGEYVPLNLLAGNTVAAGEDGTLSGTVSGFFEADMATHVLARLCGHYRLVPLDAPGVTLVERPLWDPSRRLFDLNLDCYLPYERHLVAGPDDAGRIGDLLCASAQLAIAADCLGASEMLLESTVAYLNTRRQFDRPLAMFQALKHRVADLKVGLEAAKALLWARAAGDCSTSDLGALKALCARVFLDISEEAIQLHGGIGLTVEHHCHLFFKRATLNAVLAGDIDHWQAVGGRALLEEAFRKGCDKEPDASPLQRSLL